MKSVLKLRDGLNLTVTLSQCKIVERDLPKPSSIKPRVILTSKYDKYTDNFPKIKYLPDTRGGEKSGTKPVTVYCVDPSQFKIVPPEKPVPRKKLVESPEPKGLEANKPACVYWVTDGTAVKIGYTTDLHHRLATLQTGNPRELEVLRIRQFATAKEAYQYEQRLHKQYKKYNVRGEWFNVEFK